MTRAEEAASEAYPELCRYYRDYEQLAKRQIFQQGYKKAEKGLLPKIARLAEAILFDWDNRVELAKEMAEFAHKELEALKDFNPKEEKPEIVEFK